MPTWNDLEQEFNLALRELPDKIVQATEDCAEALLWSLLVTVPIGRGPSPFLWEAMQTRSPLFYDGQAATVGISARSQLGEPDQAAPAHTIRDFLRWWRDTGAEETSRRPARQRLAGEGEEVNENTQHFSPQLAWWFLSAEQKEVLEEMREEGHFGGHPQQAPYWWIQEQGCPAAGVSAQFYLQTAREEAEPRMAEVLDLLRVM
jgi:hypothetical protein